MTTPLRIMCVDDNDLIAEAMKRWIQQSGDFEWAGSTNDPTAVIDCVSKTRPSIVLLDIDMPGSNSFELVERINGIDPGARVVMFSGHVRKDLIEKSIDSGAWGYISKNESIEAVIVALRSVARGEFVLSPEVAAENLRG